MSALAIVVVFARNAFRSLAGSTQVREPGTIEEAEAIPVDRLWESLRKGEAR